MVTPKQMITRAIIGGAAFVGTVFLLNQCAESRWQEKTDALIDSAQVARTEAEVNKALAAQAENRANVAASEKIDALERAVRSLAAADRLRDQRRAIEPVASVPGTVPTVSDTLHATKAALENCEEETVALRETIKQDTIALQKSAVIEAELRGALALERVSVAGLLDSNADLSNQLKSAAPPCRVLLWGCPSRTVVAGVSIVGTYLIVRR